MSVVCMISIDRMDAVFVNSYITVAQVPRKLQTKVRSLRMT